MPAATSGAIATTSAPAAVVKVVPSVFNGDVRSLPLSKPWYPGDPIITRPPRRMDPTTASARTLSSTGSSEPAQAIEDGTTRLPGDLPPDDIVPLAFSPPDLDIDGSGFTGVMPPDPAGDIGSQHYIQMVNDPGGSSVTIFDKSGVVQAGPFDLDSLWTGGGACANGLGDPIALYDAAADRWMLSEFASSGNHLCVYVSQTADPITGGWFNYDFATPDFPDYPKYAVWPDAYYVSTNESPDATYALERAAMLAGLPAAMLARTVPNLPGFGGFSPLIPSDLDGPTPPPAGSPNFFMRHRDDELHGPATPGSDRLEIWEYRVDWAATTATLTGPINVTVGEFDSTFCGGAFNCLPQPLVGQDIDALREPIMWRLQYRNFGAHESLVGNFVTDTDPAAGTANIHAGVRWFELRRTPPGVGAWTLFQEGTVAPDADNRWLGSIAMDGCGNIALGYSVASATTFPGINYTGRLVSDPPGTMPVGEATLIAGLGSQTAGPDPSRWGDYSAMVVDEADQCTFWFTSEYLPNVPSATNANWRTRIGSFRFPSCGLPPSPGDEVPNTSLFVRKNPLNDPTASSEIRLDWGAVTNASSYNVYRGDIDSLFVGRVYNHAASLATGAGYCDVVNSFFVDPDDQDDPTDFYYVVTAKSCMAEGTTGFDSFGVERPDGSGCP